MNEGRMKGEREMQFYQLPCRLPAPEHRARFRQVALCNLCASRRAAFTCVCCTHAMRLARIVPRTGALISRVLWLGFVGENIDQPRDFRPFPFQPLFFSEFPSFFAKQSSSGDNISTFSSTKLLDIKFFEEKIRILKVWILNLLHKFDHPILFLPSSTNTIDQTSEKTRRKHLEVCKFTRARGSVPSSLPFHPRPTILTLPERALHRTLRFYVPSFLRV